MKFEEAIAKLSEEVKDRIKDCKSIEEIFQLLKDNNIDISLDDIKKALSPKNGELSDDDLSNVVGGIDLTTIIQDVFKHFAKEFTNKKGQ